MAKLLFIYDIHYAPPKMRRSDSDPEGTGSGTESLSQLKLLMDAVSCRYGRPDFICFGGDIGDHQLRENNRTPNEGIYEINYLNYWEAVRQVFDAVEDKGFRWIATKGNHETFVSNGWYAKAVQDQTHETVRSVVSRFVRTGEAVCTETYALYCFGAGPQVMSPFDGGCLFRKEDIEALEEYLKNTPEDRPVFVMSHYPLHGSGVRENPDTDGELRRMLNRHPNVFFLWGHNHASGIRKSDEHYDAVYREELDGERIQFTYLSGGCMTPDYCGDVKGCALLASVNDKEGSVQLDYLDRKGQPVYTALVKGFCNNNCRGVLK